MQDRNDPANQPEAARTVGGLATIGERFLAQVVDAVVAFGVFFLAGMIVAPRFGASSQQGFELSGLPAGIVLAIVAAVMIPYFALAEGLRGVTLGKLVAGIRVEAAGGGRIGMRAAVIRNLVRIVDGFAFYLIAAVTVLLTKRRQRLGDLAAGSIVVRHEAPRAARVGALVAALLVGLFGVAGGLWLRPATAPAVATDPTPTASNPTASPPTTDPQTVAPGTSAAAPSDVPFTSRGWTRESAQTFSNTGHGFRVTVPAGWRTGSENRYSERILWVMSKLDNAGEERLGVNITHTPVGQRTAEEFFNDEFTSFKETSYEVDGQRKPIFTVTSSGPTSTAGMYEHRYTRNDNGAHGRNVLFVRNETGYIVVLKWVPDATAEEAAELDRVRAELGLPAMVSVLPAGTSLSPSPAGPLLSVSPAAPPSPGSLSAAASATASLSDIVVTDIKDSGTQKTTFVDQPEKIYVQFRLVDAPRGTRVRCLWIAQDAQGAPPNYKIDDVNMRMGGPVNKGTCSLSKPTGGWPTGDYRVEIYLEDRLAHTARFKVAAGTAAPATAPGASAPAGTAGERIGPVLFDSRVANNRAVNPSIRFSKGIRQVYAFFEFKGLKADDRIDGVWYQGTKEVLRQSRTVAEILGTNVAPSGRLWFSIRWPGGAAPGSYSFVVHVNGQMARTTTFVVE